MPNGPPVSFRSADDLLKFKIDDSGRRRREYNRDNKRRLNDDGMNSTYGLWGGLQDLPPNPFRRTSEEGRLQFY